LPQQASLAPGFEAAKCLGASERVAVRPCRLRPRALLHLPLKVFTHEVVTLWYRPPEVLLGQAKYGPSMDMWSLGCIMAEIATAQALFPGDSEIDTIFKIFRMLGTPNDEVWPGVSTLKDFKSCFPKWQDTGLAEVRRIADGSLGDDGIDLLASCLRYDLVSRISARRALEHQFFEAVADSSHCNSHW